MSAGRRACEIVLQRPGCEPVSLFAPSLDELKLWFGQMKSVSDVSLSCDVALHVPCGECQLDANRFVL